MCPKCGHNFKSKYDCFFIINAETATSEIKSDAVDLMTALDQSEFLHEAQCPICSAYSQQLLEVQTLLPAFVHVQPFNPIQSIDHPTVK
jgi:RNA polymerase subunit RPABC4/transcription elongation factor Spt4